MTELSGETLSRPSEVSLIPDTELALVPADDSVDGGCLEVLVVVSVSRLCLLISSVGGGTSLTVEYSGVWPAMLPVNENLSEKAWPIEKSGTGRALLLPVPRE